MSIHWQFNFEFLYLSSSRGMDRFASKETLSNLILLPMVFGKVKNLPLRSKVFPSQSRPHFQWGSGRAKEKSQKYPFANMNENLPLKSAVNTASQKWKTTSVAVNLFFSFLLLWSVRLKETQTYDRERFGVKESALLITGATLYIWWYCCVVV